MERGGENVHEHFALACDWLGELFEAGRASKSVQDGGIHRACSVGFCGIIMALNCDGDWNLPGRTESR
jgi:hypothetical protein